MKVEAKTESVWGIQINSDFTKDQENASLDTQTELWMKENELVKLPYNHPSKKTAAENFMHPQTDAFDPDRTACQLNRLKEFCKDTDVVVLCGNRSFEQAVNVVSFASAAVRVHSV